MKPRLRQILDLLMDKPGYVPVAEVAGEIGAGVRTVFRDIQELEFLLRDYGLVIEKRRSVGIRLLGDSEPLRNETRSAAAREAGSSRLSGPPRLAGLGSRHRQLATLVYLGHTDRVVKLNELATLFFVSDSCVSGDLKDLDAYLVSRGLTATLERQRGIGVTLAGTEWEIRMAILHAASELVHPQELIQHVLFDSSDERPGKLLATLRYEADRETYLEAITGAESRLGYRFSWNDFALLYLYLIIANRRTALVNDAADSAFSSISDPDTALTNFPSSVPESVARRLWASIASPPGNERSSFPQSSPADQAYSAAQTFHAETEVRRLSLFLSSLEPGEIRESNRCHPDIDRAVSALLAGLEREKSPLYSFDSRLFHTLRVGLSSLVYKKLLHIPQTGMTAVGVYEAAPPGNYAPTPAGQALSTASVASRSDSQPESQAAAAGISGAQTGEPAPDQFALITLLHGILAPILAAMYGITVRSEELAAVAITVRAAEETMAGSRRRFRVLVTCFEGIFLAQFISALLRAHFPEVTVVSALSCDRATDPWILANAVDLVVTTFPAGLTAAPEYVLSTPFNAASFRTEMTDVLARLSKAEVIRESDAESASTGEGTTGGAAAQKAEPDRTIDAALQIVSNFVWLSASEAGTDADRTSLIARLVCCGAAAKGAADKNAAALLKAETLLKADLDRREALGVVVLEESGIRLYHCRSKAVSEPRVGVIGTSCFLIAPEHAAEETVQALSRVSVALIESDDFTRAIVRGDSSSIRRQLFSILATGM